LLAFGRWESGCKREPFLAFWLWESGRKRVPFVVEDFPKRVLTCVASCSAIVAATDDLGYFCCCRFWTFCDHNSLTIATQRMRKNDFSSSPWYELLVAATTVITTATEELLSQHRHTMYAQCRHWKNTKHQQDRASAPARCDAVRCGAHRNQSKKFERRQLPQKNVKYKVDTQCMHNAGSKQ